jgi:hypothetical protein
VKALSRQSRLIPAFPGLRIDVCGLPFKWQVSGVNLPFNLLQDPCVEGVGNGENRPTFAVPVTLANVENAATSDINA